MSEEIMGAVIGAIATAAAALVGFGAVVLQIGKQGQQAIKQVRSNEVMKLRLQIYGEVTKLCDEVTTPASKFRSRVGMALFRLRFAAGQHQNGLPFFPPPERTPHFIDLSQATTQAAIGIVLIVERWEIVDPRMKVFQTAAAVALHDLHEAGRQFFALTTPAFPLDLPDGGIIPWSPPSQADLDALAQTANALESKIDQLTGWVHDLRVEFQRAMLSDLFEDRLEARSPIDQSVVVITLKRSAELIRYFDEQTEWGKMKAQAEADARALVPTTR